MSNPFSSVYSKISAVNEGAMAPVLRLGEIGVRTQALLARQQLAVLEACLGLGSRQFQALADAEDAGELLSRQAALVGEVGERLVDAVREVLDIQAQVRDELSQWLEDGVRALPLAGRAA